MSVTGGRDPSNMRSIRRGRRRGVPVAEIEFTVEYDGPGLAAGRIPARDLAPALLALAQLMRDANGVVYPNGAEVQLQIQATERGSFSLQLFLIHVGEEVWSFMHTDTADALANLLAFLGGPGLIGVAIWARNRVVVSRERLPDGRDRLTTADGDTYDTAPQAADLYENQRVREDVRDVVEPLKRDGIDTFKMARDDEVIAEVRAADVGSFDVPSGVEEQLLDDTHDAYLSVYTVPLGSPHAQWEFHDGNHVIPAAMLDDQFAADVAARSEVFRSGDVLNCRLRVQQFQKPTGELRTRYEVVEVLRHIRADPPPRVLELPIPGPAPEAVVEDVELPALEPPVTAIESADDEGTQT